MMEALHSQKILRKAMWFFFAIFLTIGAVLAGLMYLFYTLQTGSHLDSLRVREEQAVQLEAQTALNGLRVAVSDLMQLRNQNELGDFLRGNRDALAGVAKEYLALFDARGHYDQIRFLEVPGRERVSIKRIQGQAVQVPSHQLQDKRQRYYVSDTLRLNDGDVFISPLAPHKESGTVEQPFKTMIRFGTPVYGPKGTLRGLIVLNYLADTLLDQLRRIGATTLGDTMLLNSDGYWLLSPRPEDEWGFMFPERRGRTFIGRFPTEWDVLRSRENGQFITDRGLFTFTTLYPSITPLEELSSPVSDPGYAWKLLSHVSPEVLGDYSARLQSRLLTLGSVLFLLTATGSGFIALALTRQRLYQTQLETLAHFDLLTGLPNRALFFDRLLQVLEQAKRYDRPFGLLYIDLDNFKQVNDTLGHDAGDRLLAAVGNRLRNGCRKSDTVARLGGDEFVILLSEVEGRKGCEAAAEKVLAEMNAPIKLKGASRTITVSIGISLYPANGETADELLNRSDQAMYRSKMEGKNQYR